MGKFRRQDQQIQQGEFWVPTARLTRGPKDHFYARLQKVLEGMDFTGQIHRIVSVKRSPVGRMVRCVAGGINYGSYGSKVSVTPATSGGVVS